MSCPADGDQLGFGSRWYEQAAANRIVADGLDIHVVSPLFFVATKLDAYASRGSGDPYSSHDLEDIILVLRGMPEVFDELERGHHEVHHEVRRLLEPLPYCIDRVIVIRDRDACTSPWTP